MSRGGYPVPGRAYPAMAVPVRCSDPNCAICAHMPATLRYEAQPTLPPTPVLRAAWAAEFAALAAFLDARDRKLDDGDGLQRWADTGAVLSGLLDLPAGQDRV